MKRATSRTLTRERKGSSMKKIVINKSYGKFLRESPGISTIA